MNNNFIIIRIISKMGAIIVLIGFFLPLYSYTAENFNSRVLDELTLAMGGTVQKFDPHKIINGIDSLTNTDMNYWILLITSCIGVMFLILIIKKKNINIFIDWIITLIPIICIIKSIYEHNNTDYFDVVKKSFQIEIGMYIIISGLSLSFIFMLVETVFFIFKSKEEQKSEIICKNCNELIDIEIYESCQNCNCKEFIERGEIKNEVVKIKNIKKTKERTNKTEENAMYCRKCGNEIKGNFIYCSKCGNKVK